MGPTEKPSKDCTLLGRSQVVSMATTVWEATLCWTVSSSDASLADMLPSTCWAPTGRTLLWQLSQAQPKYGLKPLTGLHLWCEPQLGALFQESRRALVARASHPIGLLHIALGAVDVRKCDGFPVEAALQASVRLEAN